MDIRETLGGSRAKSTITKLVDYISDDADLFDKLMQIVLHDRSRLRWVASWCMSDCVEQYPSLLKPYTETIIQQLQDSLDVGTKRNYLRVLQDAAIPEQLHFELADVCLAFIKDKDEAIAIKAFSLTILQNLVKHIPELKEELIFEIERQMPYSTAAFISRGKQALKKLKIES